MIVPRVLGILDSRRDAISAKRAYQSQQAGQCKRLLNVSDVFLQESKVALTDLNALSVLRSLADETVKRRRIEAKDPSEALKDFFSK